MVWAVTFISLAIVAILSLAHWKYIRSRRAGVDAAALFEAKGMSDAARAECRALWGRDQGPTGSVPVSSLGGTPAILGMGVRF